MSCSADFLRCAPVAPAHQTQHPEPETLTEQNRAAFCRSTKSLRSLLRHLQDVHSYLDVEKAALEKLIYKTHHRYRNDKGLKDFKLVSKCLGRFYEADVARLLKHHYLDACPILVDVMERRADQLYLPTAQMLDFVLYRLQAVFALLQKLWTYCRLTGDQAMKRIRLGHFWNVGLHRMGVASRVWVMSKSLLFLVDRAYGCLLPQRPLLPQNQGQLQLPEGHKFPESLMQTVQDAELREEMTKVNFESLPKFEAKAEAGAPSKVMGGDHGETKVMRRVEDGEDGGVVIDRQAFYQTKKQASTQRDPLSKSHNVTPSPPPPPPQQQQQQQQQQPPKSAAKPKVNSKRKSELNSRANQEAVCEAKSKVNSKKKSEQNSKPKLEAVCEAKPKVNSKTKPEAVCEAKPEMNARPKSEQNTDPANVDVAALPCTQKRWLGLCAEVDPWASGQDVSDFVARETAKRKTERKRAVTKLLEQAQWRRLRAHLNAAAATTTTTLGTGQQKKALKRLKLQAKAWVLYPELEGKTPANWQQIVARLG